MKKTLAAGSLLLAAVIIAKPGAFAPGNRTVVLAHNAYPDHGKYADRLDRAISSGQPFVVEQDLAWVEGRSLMIHGAKNVSADDPSLESYFFPRVKPVVEKALNEGNKGNWPLITLYLDIKNDPPEHLEAISKVLDHYDAWLTTAVKTADITRQSPLDLKPLMVLVEDKQNDIKQQFFYDRLPVGGKIRVFGTPAKPDLNPGRKLSKQEALERMASMDPEQLVTAKADNYRRWWGSDWAFIEKGGQANAGAWTKQKEDRLLKFVRYGHCLGYFVSFYCLDGYTAAEDQGWDKDYNFGSREVVMERWKAAIRAKVYFVSTDQYEDVTKVIAASR